MSAHEGKDSHPTADEPRAAEKDLKRARRLRRLLVYTAPVIVSSFFISPASAVPSSGCNPNGGPCQPSITPCAPNR